MRKFYGLLPNAQEQIAGRYSFLILPVMILALGSVSLSASAGSLGDTVGGAVGGVTGGAGGAVGGVGNTVGGVAHGAGLAPVMQSAMKFAYCRTHRAITVPVTGLAKYAGIYRSAEDPALKLRLFIKNQNLYFQVGKIKTLHFVPYAKDKFFMYEDEKTDINFKNDGGKQYFLLTTLDGKPQRIDKIN